MKDSDAKFQNLTPSKDTFLFGIRIETISTCSLFKKQKRQPVEWLACFSVPEFDVNNSYSS